MARSGFQTKHWTHRQISGRRKCNVAEFELKDRCTTPRTCVGERLRRSDARWARCGADADMQPPIRLVASRQDTKEPVVELWTAGNGYVTSYVTLEHAE